MFHQVMMSIHRAPASYTGEDLVEISCHGGTLVTAKVLEACLRTGARGARPGEFTERAFLNGKMDLTQAEAVIDLIRARTDLALRSATEQLEGRLGEKISTIRGAIVDLLANIEASIDFPEEGINPDEGAQLQTRLDSICSRIESSRVCNCAPSSGLMPSSGKSIDASMLARRSTIAPRIVEIFSPNRPSSCSVAERSARSVRARIKSITASAWVRSILPLRNARSVNSPGRAALAPARRQASRTFAETSVPPWQLISTKSSPV